MTNPAPRETPLEETSLEEVLLQEVLGPIECPDIACGAKIESKDQAADGHSGLRDLRRSLSVRHRSVMRRHRNVAADSLPYQHEPVDWFARGHRIVDDSIQPSKNLSYLTGDYFLQDAGSLLALSLCFAGQQSLDGKIVCDLCAAPGGKASALLEAVGREGFLLANEPIRSRLPALRYNLARTGSDRYAVSSLDPDQLCRHVRGQFDCVLVDAPCSGQALFARGKQTEAAFSQKQIDHSAKRQERILDAAVMLLKPGGKLIYSTCTFAFAENEAQVCRLIQQRDMKPVDELRLPDDSPDSSAGTSYFLSQQNLDTIRGMQTDPGCFRVWPHLHSCAGAFAASLTNDGSRPLENSGSLNDSVLGNTNDRDAKSARKRSRKRGTPDIRPPSELDAFFQADVMAGQRLFVRESNVYAVPHDAPPWVLDHRQNRFPLSGPEIAYRTGRTWKPSHEAAIRRDHFRIARQSIEVDQAQAIQYVGGEVLDVKAGCSGVSLEGASGSDRNSKSDGWVVVQHLGRPLGWAKSSSGVAKNHLPSPFRMIGIEKS